MSLKMPSDKPYDAQELVARLNNYLGNGGFWNPDLMEHEKVRDLILDVRDFLVTTEKEQQIHEAYEAIPQGGQWEASPQVIGRLDAIGTILSNRYIGLANEYIEHLLKKNK